MDPAVTEIHQTPHFWRQRVIQPNDECPHCGFLLNNDGYCPGCDDYTDEEDELDDIDDEEDEDDGVTDA